MGVLVPICAVAVTLLVGVAWGMGTGASVDRCVWLLPGMVHLPRAVMAPERVAAMLMV